MAATGLFVELAMPTALLLPSGKIIQEKDVLLKGKAMWNATEIEEIEKKFNKSLASLMNNFRLGIGYPATM